MGSRPQILPAPMPGAVPVSLASGFTACVRTTAARRTPVGATELRQKVAHGVSRGSSGGAKRAAERRQKRTQSGGQTGFSAAPPGLAVLFAYTHGSRRGLLSAAAPQLGFGDPRKII